MDINSILTEIMKTCRNQTQASRTIANASKKISAGTATYADAQAVAIEQGKFLEAAFRKYLPEALTEDGKLYRAAAEVVVKQPVVSQTGVVADTAKQIQAMLNEQADINIEPIVPELNEDQLDGIITGICNAESFKAREETLYDQVGNFLEGYVDDCVKENADFQYEAGLEPTIERRTNGKCCKWCSALSGTYRYADVRDKGNDIWRRHKNCHCEVLYNPGNGSKRRQNVYTRQWKTDEDELRERRLHFGDRKDFEHDYSRIRARKIENYRANNLYIDQNVNLSPREIRRINGQISQAKELHGITGQCDAEMVIVNDSKTLASYNPRTNTIYINSKLADTKKTIQLQSGYACAEDSRSTIVHELFHWKDAEEYRKNIGAIVNASYTSDYSAYQRKKSLEELIKAGIDTENIEEVERRISKYAADRIIDNDFEEAYTELRTKWLLEGGVR